MFNAANRYVPKLKHNLLSVSQLAKEGFTSTFYRSKCMITGEKNEKLTCYIRNNLYRLNSVKAKNVYENVCTHKDCIHLWHLRLGHANYKTLRKTIENSTGVNLRQCDKNINCQACQVAKSKCAPAKKHSNIKVDNILDLVSIDLIGPKTASLGGAKYILSIQDQKSRISIP